MAPPVGRWIGLSQPRRFVADLMHVARQVPTVTAERRMELAPLVDARHTGEGRPSWCAIFVRAFSVVAARRPELRRSFQTFPWPHLYEHPTSVAAVAVERAWDGEEVPVIAHLAAPDQRPLAELDAHMKRFQECPLQDIASLRRARRMLRLPRPLRRLVWWAALNLHGPSRARYLGTFAITSPAAHGAGMLHLLSALTCTLHYSLLRPEGSLDVRLTFDHRVLDGAPAARALADLESVLRHDMLTEVRGMRAQAA